MLRLILHHINANCCALHSVLHFTNDQKVLLFPGVLITSILWHSSPEVKFHWFIIHYWSRFQLYFFTSGIKVTKRFSTVLMFSQIVWWNIVVSLVYLERMWTWNAQKAIHSIAHRAPIKCAAVICFTHSIYISSQWVYIASQWTNEAAALLLFPKTFLSQEWPWMTLAWFLPRLDTVDDSMLRRS